LKNPGGALEIEILKADYYDNRHCAALIALLDAYAQDPMGGGCALTEHVKQNLIGELQRRSSAYSVLAFADGQPAGLVNCFEAFSTFACRPLVNIHDLVVLAGYRGLRIGQLMLQVVEQIALERGCCKLTLEVLQGNLPALDLYRKFGFAAYQLAAENGNAVFWQKRLA
jgi:ribosomal protein S18 acetylase RimI-like enzyme